MLILVRRIPVPKVHVETDEAVKRRIKNASILRDRDAETVAAMVSHYSGSQLDELCRMIDVEPRRIWST
jgi:hypothetical protein